MTKTCFVLWSAGVDSTYLIIRLLEAGFIVSSAYCEIRNNASKTKMEKSAIKALAEQIKIRFPNTFTFQGTIYRGENNSQLYRGIKYKQVPYFMHALIVAPRTEYRALAYVKGDSSIKNLENIRKVYNSYKNISYGNFPQLIFPLRGITKPEIFAHMQKTYPEILANCVWCAKPQGDNFEPCNICSPCVRRNKELQVIRNYNV